jgi:hypothetical protein
MVSETPIETRQKSLGLLHLVALWLMLTLAGSTSVSASGFPKQPGEVTIILGHYRYMATSFWNNSRTVEQYGSDGRYGSATTKLFAEMGIDGNLTLFGSVPYAVATFENTFGSSTSKTFTDAELGARYRIRRGPNERYHLSLQGMLLVPLYQTGLNPVPGYRQTGVDVRVMRAGSHTLGSRPAFYSVDTGIRMYPGSEILQWVYTLGGGFQLRPGWEFLYEFSGTISRSGDTVFTPENILLNTDFSSHKVGAGVLWKPSDNFGIIANVYADYLGRQSARGRAFNLSILLFI